MEKSFLKPKTTKEHRTMRSWHKSAKFDLGPNCSIAGGGEKFSVSITYLQLTCSNPIGMIVGWCDNAQRSSQSEMFLNGL
jgi:hypothetical protein